MRARPTGDGGQGVGGCLLRRRSSVPRLFLSPPRKPLVQVFIYRSNTIIQYIQWCLHTCDYPLETLSIGIIIHLLLPASGSSISSRILHAAPARPPWLGLAWPQPAVGSGSRAVAVRAVLRQPGGRLARHPQEEPGVRLARHPPSGRLSSLTTTAHCGASRRVQSHLRPRAVCTLAAMKMLKYDPFLHPPLAPPCLNHTSPTPQSRHPRSLSSRRPSSHHVATRAALQPRSAWPIQGHLAPIPARTLTRAHEAPTPPPNLKHQPASESCSACRTPPPGTVVK